MTSVLGSLEAASPEVGGQEAAVTGLQLLGTLGRPGSLSVEQTSSGGAVQTLVPPQTSENIDRVNVDSAFLCERLHSSSFVLIVRLTFPSVEHLGYSDLEGRALITSASLGSFCWF